MSKIPQENLGEALEAAVREAVDDKTYQKVKRCSYAPGSQDIISHLLNKGGKDRSSRDGNAPNLNDPAILESLVKALLGQQEGNTTTPHQAFNRMSRLSRSFRHGSMRNKNENSRRSSWLLGQNQGGGSNESSTGQLPTIMEGNSLKNNETNSRAMSLSERALNTPIVRNFLSTLANVPQRLNVGSEHSESRGRFGRRNSETPLTKNQI